MHTIKMDNDKNLFTSVRTNIFQKENMVDKIQFLIPKGFNELGLENYIALLKYVDPNGNFQSEVLTVDTETFENYLKYELPVTTKLTQVAGTITFRITFILYENEDVVDKMETNSTTLTILKPDGFSDYVNFEDIKAIQEQLGKMPTDLEIDESDNLHLVHNDEKIGEGVEILVPTDMDLDDGNHDGIIEIDDLPEDENPEFIELDD